MPRVACTLALAFAIACSNSSGGGQDQNDKPDPKPPSPTQPADAGTVAVTLAPAQPLPLPPLGLPATPSPKHNRTTAEKAALGRLLFFDPRLSAHGAASCSSCHAAERGFADPNRLSKTAAGQTNLRHAPALANAAYVREYYWDGRVSPLEALIDANWRGQMAADPDEIAKRLADNPTYAAHFRRAFEGAASGERIIEALASYVRTLRSGNSAWDRYQAGDSDAVSAEVIAGAALFRSKAECAQCHPPPLYTDQRYHNVGIGSSTQDRGRAAVTKRDRDLGAFRTPTLRGAANSAPYFHDGSAADLQTVIDHFLARTNGPDGAITLSADERRQLLAFVLALTPSEPPFAAPKLP